MFCNKCGAKNDDDAKFCEKCGKSLKNGLSSPSNFKEPVKTEGMSKSTKMLIIACIILVAVIGITAGVLLQMNKGESSANPISVNQSPTQVTYQATWHEVTSFSGTTSDMRSFTIKGNRFKVVISAMPLLNYNTNSISIDIKDTNNTILTSGTIDWSPDAAVSQKEKTIEVTAKPGTYYTTIITKDIGSWTLKVYDYY